MICRRSAIEQKRLFEFEPGYHNVDNHKLRLEEAQDDVYKIMKVVLGSNGMGNPKHAKMYKEYFGSAYDNEEFKKYLHLAFETISGSQILEEILPKVVIVNEDIVPKVGKVPGADGIKTNCELDPDRRAYIS